MTNRPPSQAGSGPVRARRHHRYLLSIGVAHELRDELDRLLGDEPVSSEERVS